MTEAIIIPPFLPNLDMKRPPTWPPVTGQNKVTITQVTLCSDWLIRGVTLSSDWLIILTYQRPHRHQTAHPADHALGQVESILKTATWFRIREHRRESHFTWSGGSWRRGEAGLDQAMQVPITRLPRVAAKVAKYWGPFLDTFIRCEDELIVCSIVQS